MLASGHQRRGTMGTIRSFKTMFGRNDYEEEPAEPISTVLTTLSLPQSLSSLDNFSPGLWTWINSNEYLKSDGKEAPPRVFSPAGELISELPPHLIKLNKLTSSASSGSLNTIDEPKKSKTLRKPVPSIETQKVKTKRFFVKVMEIGLKRHPNSNIVCVITTGDQKRCTSVLPVSRHHTVPKGNSFTSVANEGFLFDILHERDEFMLSVRVYSCENPMLSSPSIESFSSNSFMKSRFSMFSNLKRSGTINSTNIIQPPPLDKIPAPPNALGELIGDFSIIIPSEHAFSKVTGSHSIYYGKKEVAKIQLQMGIYLDTKFSPAPEIPQGPSSISNYMNFQLMTRGGLVWRKDWVIASHDGLEIKRIGNHTEAGSLAFLGFSDMLYIKKADKLCMPIPFALEICFRLPLSQSSIDDELACKWKDAFIEAGDFSKNTLQVWVYCDSEAQFDSWFNFIDSHVKAYLNWKK